MKFKKNDIIQTKSGTRFKVESYFDNVNKKNIGYILKLQDRTLFNFFLEHDEDFSELWIKRERVERNCRLVSDEI